MCLGPQAFVLALPPPPLNGPNSSRLLHFNNNEKVDLMTYDSSLKLIMFTYPNY